MSKIIFEDLSSENLQHPLDKKALHALQKIKGIDLISKKIFELGIERIGYLVNIASSLEVSDKQCKDIDDQVKTCLKILDMPEEPNIFIENSPYINAYTSGYTNPYIVLTSGIVERFNEDELLAVIGHELGHIKCAHAFYQYIAQNLRIFTQIIDSATFGFGDLLSIPFQYALMEWQRKSEFSADRASLLVTQDANIAIDVMIKLSAGLNQQYNREAFLLQGEKFEEIKSNDKLSKIYSILMTAELSHPWLAVRAAEINDWSKSEEYKRILSGEYIKSNELDLMEPNTTCPNCSKEIASSANFCSYCWVRIE